MDKMTRIGSDLKETLEGAIKKGELAALLRQLLTIPDECLAAVLPAIIPFAKSFEGRELQGEEGEGTRWDISLYGSILKMMTADRTSTRMFAAMEHVLHERARAVAYLPEPFRGYQQMGAILLAAKLGGARLRIDLSQVAIRWANRLGKPKLQFGDFLKKHPYMVPVCFSGVNAIESAAEHPREFYGDWPFLDSDASPDRLLASCRKWPTEHAFAFCPLPIWAADHAGEAFWLENLTWPEQQAELARLQRQHPWAHVCFAKLHELAFLDITWRLATFGSPMEIYMFRCENPDEEGGCLIYGGVDQQGAKIEELKRPSETTWRVLPLFFIESEKEDKKK